MPLILLLGDERNPAAYLGLDLDSTISSVSDPDISGLSREDKKKCDGDGSISSKLTGVNEQSTKNKREGKACFYATELLATLH